MGLNLMKFKLFFLRALPKGLRFRLLRLARTFKMPGDVKLNLGSGDDPKFGYINIDRNPKYGPDIQGEALSVLKFFNTNYVIEILAIHLINYFSHSDLLSFLQESYRILDNKGQLIIESPDFEKLLDKIKSAEFEPSLLYPLFATSFNGPSHNSPYLNAVTFKWLEKECNRIGFKEVVVSPPQTHGMRVMRDSRLTAIK